MKYVSAVTISDRYRSECAIMATAIVNSSSVPTNALATT